MSKDILTLATELRQAMPKVQNPPGTDYLFDANGEFMGWLDWCRPEFVFDASYSHKDEAGKVFKKLGWQIDERLPDKEEIAEKFEKNKKKT